MADDNIIVALQREVRFLKHAIVILAAIPAALLLLRATQKPQYDSLAVHELVVLDENGNTIARLGTTTGIPSLALAGPNGPAVGLAGGAQPGLFLSTDGKPRAGITVQGESSQLELTDTSGATTVSLSNEAFGPALVLAPTGTRNPRLIATCDKAGPAIRLLGPTGDVRAGLLVTTDGQKSSIMLNDGSDTSAALIVSDHSAIITAANPNAGTAQLTAIQGSPLPSLTMFDKDQKIIMDSKQWKSQQ